MKNRIVSIEGGNWCVTLTAGRMYNSRISGKGDEYVRRTDLAKALRKGSTEYVSTYVPDDPNYLFERLLRSPNGKGFSFGCCNFNTKEAAIIRKWAFAKRKKTRKGTK